MKKKYDYIEKGSGETVILLHGLMGAMSNFKSTIDGVDLHFIHEKGSGNNPTPLLLSHGWPGSIFEFLHIIDQLAHPEKYGGKEEDAFDVIVHKSFSCQKQWMFLFFNIVCMASSFLA